jgi:adenylate cyclase
LGFSSALIFLSAVLAISVVKLTSTPSWTIVALSSVLLVMPTCLSIAFWFYNYWVSPLPLFVAGICAGGGELLYVYRTVWREQSLMANALKNSMSANMVELVRSGHVKVSRFGELKPVTVLFSDLVGFTEISERLSPHDLVLVLNGYFDEVVNLVTTGQGYVDKFIGDAVMAFWGAPVSQDNHAQLAFQAAVNFHRAAERYNEKLERKFPGLPALGTRLGLHSGLAVVGNIGASHRHNYTAIGDTVNVAARLESLCSQYGVQLIFSDSVLQESGFQGRHGVVELDHVVVKGKKESTRIYTYISQWNADDIGNYRRGLAFYYRGEWKSAAAILELCDFAPAKVILKRCQQCETMGVPAEFVNGVWSFETK